MDTIKEAQEYLTENFDRGIICPCCEQLVKKYKRKINSAMARSLISLFKLTEHQGDNYFHVSEFDPTRSGGSEISKLLFWGCVLPQINKDTKKKHSGMWKITKLGKEFVQSQTTLPKYCWLYNGELLGLDKDSITDIIDSVGDQFDYEELMRET